MIAQQSPPMRGEVYVDEGAEGFFVVHMSETGDSSGVERGYPTRAAAEVGARNLAKELGALFVPSIIEGAK